MSELPKWVLTLRSWWTTAFLAVYWPIRLLRAAWVGFVWRRITGDEDDE